MSGFGRFGSHAEWLAAFVKENGRAPTAAERGGRDVGALLAGTAGAAHEAAMLAAFGPEYTMAKEHLAEVGSAPSEGEPELPRQVPFEEQVAGLVEAGRRLGEPLARHEKLEWPLPLTDETTTCHVGCYDPVFDAPVVNAQVYGKMPPWPQVEAAPGGWQPEPFTEEFVAPTTLEAAAHAQAFKEWSSAKLTELLPPPLQGPQGSTDPKTGEGSVALAWLPWAALEAVGRVLDHGAVKHGRDSWQRSFPAGEGPQEVIARDEGRRKYLSAALRHISQELRGVRLDDGPGGSGELHLAHAACNVLFVLEALLYDGFAQSSSTATSSQAAMASAVET